MAEILSFDRNQSRFLQKGTGNTTFAEAFTNNQNQNQNQNNIQYQNLVSSRTIDNLRKASICDQKCETESNLAKDDDKIVHQYSDMGNMNNTVGVGSTFTFSKLDENEEDNGLPTCVKNGLTREQQIEMIRKINEINSDVHAQGFKINGDNTVYGKGTPAGAPSYLYAPCQSDESMLTAFAGQDCPGCPLVQKMGEPRNPHCPEPVRIVPNGCPAAINLGEDIPNKPYKCPAPARMGCPTKVNYEDKHLVPPGCPTPHIVYPPLKVYPDHEYISADGINELDMGDSKLCSNTSKNARIVVPPNCQYATSDGEEEDNNCPKPFKCPSYVPEGMKTNLPDSCPKPDILVFNSTNGNNSNNLELENYPTTTYTNQNIIVPAGYQIQSGTVPTNINYNNYDICEQLSNSKKTNLDAKYYLYNGQIITSETIGEYNNISHEECQKKCNASNLAKGYVYHSLERKCELKSDVSEIIRGTTTSIVSGVKKINYNTQNGYVLQGNKYRTYNDIKTQNECEKKCTLAENSTGYSYRLSTEECVLMKGDSQKIKEADDVLIFDVSSGIKNNIQETFTNHNMRESFTNACPPVILGSGGGIGTTGDCNPRIVCPPNDPDCVQQAINSLRPVDPPTSQTATMDDVVGGATAFQSNYADSIAQHGTFRYHLLDDKLNEYSQGKFSKTGFYSKNFRNVWELYAKEIYINILKTQTGKYKITFKVENETFEAKLTTRKVENENVSYLEKQLIEDRTNQNTLNSRTYTTVADDIDEELRLPGLNDMTIIGPEYEFYTNKTYSSLYIKVFTGDIEKWLSFDKNNQFILVSNFTDATNMVNYLFDSGILPVLYVYELEYTNDMDVGIPIETTFNTNQITNVNPFNVNLPNVELIINYELDTGSNGITGTQTKNNIMATCSTTENNMSCDSSVYKLSYNNLNGKTFYLGAAEKNDRLYLTEVLTEVDAVPLQFFQTDSGKVCIMAIHDAIKTFKNENDDTAVYSVDYNNRQLAQIIDTQIWLGINKNDINQSLVFVENVNDSLDLREYLKESKNEVKIQQLSGNIVKDTYQSAKTMNNATSLEQFDNFTRPARSTKPMREAFENESNHAPLNDVTIPYKGHKMVSRPRNLGNAKSWEECQKFCQYDPGGKKTNSFLGTFYDSNPSENDNCFCYSDISMSYTNENNHTVTTLKDPIPDHKNAGKSTKTTSKETLGSCLEECRLDKNGNLIDTNKTVSFDSNKTEDNCTCHEETIIRPAKGHYVKTIPTVEVEEDYEPIQKYIETSDLIEQFFTPQNTKIFMILKIVTAIVALITYLYFSHYDMGFMKGIKVILVMLFSEFYLLYQFINIYMFRGADKFAHSY